MKTRLTLRPGQNGTKKLQAKYGDRLLAVRYRYDIAKRARIKTVELIEEELPWTEPLLRGALGQKPVLLRIAYAETALRSTVKSAGGQWNAERRLWQLPMAEAHALGLQERIVEK